MAKKKKKKQMDEKDLVAKALGHPMRRSIVEALFNQDRLSISPSELAEQMELPLQDVAYHIRVLADCKAVKLVKTKPARGSIKHFYRLSTKFIEGPAASGLIELGG